MDDLNKALNHLFGFKVPIDDYDEFEKKVEEAREIKEHLDKVEILKDIPQIITPVKMTNYDRIKSMSVEEMAGLIVDFHFVFQCKSYGLNPKTVYENMSEADKKKNKEWEEEMRPIWERWLLQEASEDDR